MPTQVFVEAQDLGYTHAGGTLFERLSFRLGAGLAWVQGGESRGKTTLLRLIAGDLSPSAGRLHVNAGTIYFEQPALAQHDDVPARAWLAARRAAQPRWDEHIAAALVEGFDLAEHLDKPMFKLSTGSRRKVGLVGAAAARAGLTLLDMPFAALDGASCRLLAELLAEAATLTDRAWVVADYAVPDSLAGVRLAGLIDLGDEAVL